MIVKGKEVGVVRITLKRRDAINTVVNNVMTMWWKEAWNEAPAMELPVIKPYDVVSSVLVASLKRGADEPKSPRFW